MIGKEEAVRTGGRPSREDAALIADRIVETAREQFFTHGYGATSIETIAREAGISKRTFYHRFANKAAVFQAVANRLVHSIKPADMDHLFEGADLEQVLRKLGRAILQASLSPQTLALQRLLIAEATRFPELALAMNEQGARQDALRRIATLLEAETTAGRLVTRDPLLAAEMFLQMTLSLPQRRAMGLGQPMTDRETSAWIDNAVHVFLHGYRAP